MPRAKKRLKAESASNVTALLARGLLERKELDACLFVGTEGVSEMSPQAVTHLHNIPTIALDHPTVESFIPPTVRFTTAVYGIHLPGTAYRMDEVPIPLRRIMASKYPGDADILHRIRDQITLP